MVESCKRIESRCDADDFGVYEAGFLFFSFLTRTLSLLRQLCAQEAQQYTAQSDLYEAIIFK